MRRNPRFKKRVTTKKMKLKKKRLKTRNTKAEKRSTTMTRKRTKKTNGQTKMITNLCHRAKVVFVMRNKMATTIVQAKKRMRTIN